MYNRSVICAYAHAYTCVSSYEKQSKCRQGSSLYIAMYDKFLLLALSFTTLGTYHGYQYYIGDTEVDYSTIFYDCGSYEMAVIRDLQTQLALLTDITNAGER